MKYILLIAIVAYCLTYMPHTKASSLSPSTPLRTYADQQASSHGLSVYLFERQINQESSWQTDVVSTSGAIGIAQFMPSTAYALGVNPYNPYQSLAGMASLMSQYVSRYGSFDKALAAYNCGEGCLQSADIRCGWNWKGCIPSETRSYIGIIDR